MENLTQDQATNLEKAKETIGEILKKEDDGEMKTDIVTPEVKEQPVKPVSGKKYPALRRLKTSDGLFEAGDMVYESHTDFEQLMKNGYLGQEVK